MIHSSQMPSMKQLFFILFISGGLAFTPRLLQAQPEESGDRLKAIAHAWIEALDRHDLPRLTALYADSVLAESSGWDEVKHRPADIREAYGRYFKSSPDLHYQLTNLVIGQRELVLEYSSTGTMQNLENQVPSYMAGKKYTLKNCTRLDIREGRIIGQATYFDQVSFLRQVGFFDKH
jgi:steroid delta-isomerase-like uncharacterized protein